MIDRRSFRNIDFWMIFSTLALVGIGILMIGSATHINTPSDDRYWYVQRQGMFAVLNFMLILVMLRFDYRILGPPGNRRLARSAGFNSVRLPSSLPNSPN